MNRFLCSSERIIPKPRGLKRWSALHASVHQYFGLVSWGLTQAVPAAARGAHTPHTRALGTSSARGSWAPRGLAAGLAFTGRRNCEVAGTGTARPLEA